MKNRQFIGCLLLLGATFGCQEKEYRDRQLTLDGPALPRRQRRRDEHLPRASDTTSFRGAKNACMIFRVVGANGVERRFATPMNWSDGWLSVMARTPVRQGRSMKPSLCICKGRTRLHTTDELLYGTSCSDDAPWCLLKLTQYGSWSPSLGDPRLR